MPNDEDLRERLRVSLLRHSGVIARVAEDMGWKRQKCSREVARLGLQTHAAELRAQGHLRGSRPGLVGGRLDPAGEEQALREAVDRAAETTSWDPDRVAEELGLSRRVLYRRMEVYQIAPPTDDPAYREKQKQRLVAALKDNSQSGAARLLGISHTSVQRWIKALRPKRQR